MVLMLLYAAVGGMWHVPRVLLMATNQHIELALWSVVVGGVSVGLAWSIGMALQLNGVAAAMLIGELLIAIVCSWQAYSAVTGTSHSIAVPS
jgi:hypothetical protein